MTVAALTWLTLALIALLAGFDPVTVQTLTGAAVVCALLANTSRKEKP